MIAAAAAAALSRVVCVVNVVLPLPAFHVACVAGLSFFSARIRRFFLRAIDLHEDDAQFERVGLRRALRPTDLMLHYTEYRTRVCLFPAFCRDNDIRYKILSAAGKRIQSRFDPQHHHDHHQQ